MIQSIILQFMLYIGNSVEIFIYKVELFYIKAHKSDARTDIVENYREREQLMKSSGVILSNLEIYLHI